MGMDPVLDPSERIVALAPAALLYDPTSRDWTLDENENPNGSHPVDQQIAVELFFAAKSIRSSPDTGNEIGAITHID
ncbi:MAG TPA: hypothetical protein VHO25_07160, partial [Polyangiaceae bacterium]|nr:hypothetical protein [Polyangiaceae bacterium]